MVEPVRHRRTKGAATDMFEPKATASHLDSTLPGHCALSNLSPLSGVHRKSDFGAVRAAFDPSPTSVFGQARSHVTGGGLSGSKAAKPIVAFIFPVAAGVIIEHDK